MPQCHHHSTDAKAHVDLCQPTLPPKAEGRFGKQDFRYVTEEDVYICPAGERLAYSFTTSENGLVLRRYSTKVCQSCGIKNSCTTGKERRITRWEHEHVLEAVQRLSLLKTPKAKKFWSFPDYKF